MNSLDQSMRETERCDQLRDLLAFETGASPAAIRIIRSPFRVCPLGAHIDHQLGIVTGMTIDTSIILALLPRDDERVIIRSNAFPGTVEFSIDAIPPAEKGEWGNYARGAASALRSMFPGERLRGFRAIVDGRMPIGGLSSSAAVTIAYLLGLEYVNELRVSPRQNIDLVRCAENGYIGLHNGILDQSVILCSEPGRLTKIDCEDVQIGSVAGPTADFGILVAFSGVSRQLMGTDYNRRVSECEAAARQLLARNGRRIASPKLRMVPPELFEEYHSSLEPLLRRRAEHFFGEMKRVRLGIEAWRQGDIFAFGELMTKSGQSSIENYECGSAELITLYRSLCGLPGVIGTRFSGAGFGGSCIALIQNEAFEDLESALRRIYTASHPRLAPAFSCHLCHPDGAARVV